MERPDAEENQPSESPATWENVVAGKAKEIWGHATGDAGLEQEGENQVEVAEEVRKEHRDQ